MTSGRWRRYYWWRLAHAYVIFGGAGIVISWNGPPRWQTQAFSLLCVALVVGFTLLYLGARRRNLSPMYYLSMLMTPRSMRGER